MHAVAYKFRSARDGEPIQASAIHAAQQLRRCKLIMPVSRGHAVVACGPSQERNPRVGEPNGGQSADEKGFEVLGQLFRTDPGNAANIGSFSPHRAVRERTLWRFHRRIKINEISIRVTKIKGTRASRRIDHMKDRCCSVDRSLGSNGVKNSQPFEPERESPALSLAIRNVWPETGKPGSTGFMTGFSLLSVAKRGEPFEPVEPRRGVASRAGRTRRPKCRWRE